MADFSTILEIAAPTEEELKQYEERKEKEHRKLERKLRKMEHDALANGWNPDNSKCQALFIKRKNAEKLDFLDIDEDNFTELSEELDAESTDAEEQMQDVNNKSETLEKVAEIRETISKNMLNIYGQVDGKYAIGMALKYLNDDNNSTEILRSNGFNSVEMRGALCGVGENKTEVTEWLILDASQLRILKDNESALFVLNHFTARKFEHFENEFIGSGHGTSLGNGFYFTPDELPQYGNKLRVAVDAGNTYVIEDSTNIDELTDYVATFTIPGYKSIKLAA